MALSLRLSGKVEILQGAMQDTLRITRTVFSPQ